MKLFNNKRFAKNTIVALGLLFTNALLTQVTVADTNSLAIDQKQQNQKERIVQGVNSGELTAKETWRLAKQQGKLYHKEQRFKADGQFTRQERAAIHRDLLKSSKSIYVQKHDRQVQGIPHAGIRHSTINHRQLKQVRRIGQGIRSGELTRGEAIRLGQQQKRINQQKRRLKADGTFTKRERIRVHKHQNRASKNIYRKKHNARRL